MRPWMAAPIVFAVSVLVALTSDIPTVRAQDKKPAPVPPVEENFTTADGVRLRGLFHKSPKGGQGDPVVILLYPPGPGNTMLKPGDWDGLTVDLNEKGFHVFRFDWRGHGKSTDITDTDKFWDNPFTGPWNKKYVKGANKKPVKNDLNVKTDWDYKYFLPYVTDLAAARMHIDQKNDQGDLNSSSIYLIGAGNTATLGMLWMAAEWYRPAIHPLLAFGQTYKVVPTPGIETDPAGGSDIAGAIWLSATRQQSVPAHAVQGWAKNPKMRENNHMLFLFGDQDPAAKDSKWFFNEVLVARGNKQLGVKELDQTFLTPIPKSKLTGVALLGNNADLKTEDTILKYLAARQKDRVSLTRKERKYPGPYFIDLHAFGMDP